MKCLCLYCGDQSRPMAVHEHDILVFHAANNLGPVFRVQERGIYLLKTFICFFCEGGGRARGGSSELD